MTVRPWHSWHLHAGTLDSGALDRLLIDVVAPVVEAYDIRGWFFIRYWHRGPHLRLRIADLDPPTADAIEADLIAAGSALDDGGPALDQRAYQRASAAIAAAGEASGPVDVGTVRPAGVYRETYVPEFDRYGGAALIDDSERLFHASSLVALDCVRRGADPNAAGLTALAVTCGVLPWPPDGFLDTIRVLWTRWLARGGADVEAIDRATSTAAAALGPSSAVLSEALGGQHPPLWNPWTAELSRAVDAWRAALDPPTTRAVAGSHVHMMLNRLGVAAGSDAYLAGILLAVARHAPANA
ncbi:MAG TPA: thiopeptide-type bacteriocin biosynthesis protein [Micromonosporaceae bacterium]